LLLAFLSVPVLVSGMPTEVPRVEEIRIDHSILGFTLELGLLTGLAFGAMPAIRSSWQGSPGSLRIDERGSSASFGRAASVLVVAEMAVAVVLVVNPTTVLRLD
jgi:putative ABC transport system permease protein